MKLIPHILICPERIPLLERIQGLAGELGPKARKLVFFGDEDPGKPFWDALTLTGLFAEPKLVVIRRAQDLPDAFFVRFSDILARIGAGVSQPVLCLEGGWEKGQPPVPKALEATKAFEAAKAAKRIWTRGPLSPGDMPDVVRQRAKDLGIQAAPALLAEIASLLPPDSATVDSELHKLALLSHGRQLAPEDLGVLAVAEPFDLFALTKAATDPSAAAKAWRAVAAARASGDPSAVFATMAMLAREARLLWSMAVGEEPPGRPLPQRVAQAKAQLAKRIGARGASRLLEAVLAAEVGIKSGEMEPDQALERLTDAVSRIVAA